MIVGIHSITGHRAVGQQVKLDVNDIVLKPPAIGKSIAAADIDRQNVRQQKSANVLAPV